MAKKICIFASIVFFVALFVISINIDTNQQSKPMHENNEIFKVEVLPFESKISLVNSVVKEWMQGNYTVKELYDKNRNSFGRLDYPVPLQIDFLTSGVPDGSEIVSQIIELSENEDFLNPLKVTVENHKNEAIIYNLKTDCKYFYRITVTLSSGESCSANGEFITEYSPRFIKIDGARNVRDIGGYKLENGKRIRQGMIYRGSELDGSMDSEMVISESGIDVMVNQLQIKTEMDLRFSTGLEDALGDNVDHIYYNCAWSYSDILSQKGKAFCKTFFSDLAKEKIYPVYIHCSYGSDRTGTLCFLIMALLGASEEQCYEEWELSNFYNGGSYIESMDKFVEDLNALEGDTLQEKVEKFLLSSGLSMSEINSIRNIMLVEY